MGTGGGGPGQSNPKAVAIGGGGGPGQLDPKAVMKDPGPKGQMAKGLLGPRPVESVVQLITKLDDLTADPAKLQLTDEQRAKLVEQLGPLDEPEFLSDFLANQQMDAMLAVLKNQRQILETAGFKWPNAIYDPYQRPPKNPFKEGEAAKHLKSLEDRLAKAK
jgi:hypothetical protein